MSHTRWSEVREHHIAMIGGEDVEQGKKRALARVRAHKLVEVRKRLGITQRDVARTTGVTVSEADCPGPL